MTLAGWGSPWVITKLAASAGPLAHRSTVQSPRRTGPAAPASSARADSVNGPPPVQGRPRSRRAISRSLRQDSPMSRRGSRTAAGSTRCSAASMATSSSRSAAGRGLAHSPGAPYRYGNTATVCASPSRRTAWPSRAGTGAATNPRPASRRSQSAASIAARSPEKAAGRVRPSQLLSSRASTVTNHRPAGPAVTTQW